MATTASQLPSPLQVVVAKPVSMTLILGLFTLALLGATTADDELSTIWETPPVLETFASYEDMQRYFDHRNQRRLRHIENPLKDSYIEAYNQYNEQAEEQRIKRSAPEQQEVKPQPALINFEMSDAVEPSDEVKQLIRQYKSRELQQNEKYMETVPPSDVTNVEEPNQPVVKKNYANDIGKQKIFGKRLNRSKRSLPQQHPPDFKVKYIPFDVTDAREPDAQTRMLIKRMRALEIERLAKKLPLQQTGNSSVTDHLDSPGTTTKKPFTKRPKFTKQWKPKRVRREAAAPEMIKFEISDAKDPDPSLKTFMNTKKTRETKDLKLEGTTAANSAVSTDAASSDQSSQDTKSYFFYKQAPTKVKKSIDAIPHDVQNIISHLIKGGGGGGGFGGGGAGDGKAYLKHIPAQQIDYNNLKVAYPIAKGGGAIYGHGGGGGGDGYGKYGAAVPVKFIYQPVPMGAVGGHGGGYEGGGGGGGYEGGGAVPVKYVAVGGGEAGYGAVGGGGGEGGHGGGYFVGGGHAGGGGGGYIASGGYAAIGGYAPGGGHAANVGYAAGGGHAAGLGYAAGGGHAAGVGYAAGGDPAAGAGYDAGGGHAAGGGYAAAGGHAAGVSYDAGGGHSAGGGYSAGGGHAAGAVYVGGGGHAAGQGGGYEAQGIAVKYVAADGGEGGHAGGGYGGVHGGGSSYAAGGGGEGGGGGHVVGYAAGSKDGYGGRKGGGGGVYIGAAAKDYGVDAGFVGHANYAAGGGKDHVGGGGGGEGHVVGGGGGGAHIAAHVPAAVANTAVVAEGEGGQQKAAAYGAGLIEFAAAKNPANEAIKAIPAPQFKGETKYSVVPTVEQYAKTLTQDFHLKLYSPESLIAKAQLIAKDQAKAIAEEGQKAVAAAYSLAAAKGAAAKGAAALGGGYGGGKGGHEDGGGGAGKDGGGHGGANEGLGYKLGGDGKGAGGYGGGEGGYGGADGGLGYKVGGDGHGGGKGAGGYGGGEGAYSGAKGETGYGGGGPASGAGPVIKIEYHAPAESFKGNYKDIPEFQQLSALVGKSPEDQIHGLTYLLAKEMQNRLHLQRQHNFGGGGGGKGGGGREAKGAGSFNAGKGANGGPHGGEVLDARPQDNKAPVLFQPQEALGGGGVAEGGKGAGGGGGGGGFYQPIVGKFIGMAKAKQYIPVIEQAAAEELKGSALGAKSAADGSGLVGKLAGKNYGLSSNFKGLDGLKAFAGGVGAKAGDELFNVNAYEEAAAKLQSYASKYAFGYRIRDFNTGNDFGHKQNRDLNGVTRGQYHILLPDGRVQNVIYHADDTGFHADVSFESGR